MKHKFNDIYLVIFLFITWRLFIFTVAAIAPKFIPNFGGTFPYYNERLISTGLPYYIWSFGNFDGVHYLGIARDAYAYQFTQAFFPLYPILIKLVSMILFNKYLISALLISNICFLAALLLFYNLTKRIYSKSVALWSCVFLISFPTSFYFGSIYTESLFLLLVVLSFYFFEQNKIILASLIGGIASFSRLVGIFLAPALVKKITIKNLIPILIVPTGLIIYMIYLQYKFHNALYFLTAQSAFGQERATTKIVLLPQVIYRWIAQITSSHGPQLFVSTFELAATLFALLTLIVGARKVKREWLIFSSLALITPTLTGSLASMPRYILVAFPIFIILAHIKNLYIKLFITATFIILLTYCVSMFTRGYWIA
ncbi:MAG: mannosyltransferase family protein [Patescibacteria group bacterium]